MPDAYKLFLSYSHEDVAAAAALHSLIEGFPLPAQARVTVFRDRTSLPATGALTAAIQEALDGADRLVILLSPHSARASWVDREVTWFVARCGLQRVSFVLLAGGVPWDAQAGYLPAVSPTVAELVRRSGDVPLHIDLRTVLARPPRGLRTDPAAIEAAAAILAATLGVGKDRLIGERLVAERERRRSRLRLTAVFAGLTAVGAVTTALVLGLTEMMTDAREARRDQELVHRASSATATPFQSLALLREVRDPDGAYGYAEAAEKVLSVDIAPVVGRFDGDVEHFRWEEDGLSVRVALGDARGVPPKWTDVWSLDVTTGQIRQSVGEEISAADGVGRIEAVEAVVSPDGTMWARSDQDNRILVGRTGEPASSSRVRGTAEGPVDHLVWSPDGSLLASLGSGLRVWAVGDDAPPATLAAPWGFRYQSPQWSPDSRRISAALTDGGLAVWSVGASRHVSHGTGKALSDHLWTLTDWCPSASTAREWGLATSVALGRQWNAGCQEQIAAEKRDAGRCPTAEFRRSSLREGEKVAEFHHWRCVRAAEAAERHSTSETWLTRAPKILLSLLICLVGFGGFGLRIARAQLDGWTSTAPWAGVARVLQATPLLLTAAACSAALSAAVFDWKALMILFAPCLNAFICSRWLSSVGWILEHRGPLPAGRATVWALLLLLVPAVLSVGVLMADGPADWSELLFPLVVFGLFGMPIGFAQWKLVDWIGGVGTHLGASGLPRPHPE